MAPEFFPFILFGFLAALTIGVVAAVVFINPVRWLLQAGFAILMKFLRPVLVAALVVLVVLLLLVGHGIYQQYFLNEPMAGAALEGDINRVRDLLDRGASPDAYGVDYMNPALVYAAKGGHREIVQLLIDRGVDPNLRDWEGKTALDRAGENRHREIVDLLKQAGATE